MSSFYLTPSPSFFDFWRHTNTIHTLSLPYLYYFYYLALWITITSCISTLNTTQKNFLSPEESRSMDKNCWKRDRMRCSLKVKSVWPILARKNLQDIAPSVRISPTRTVSPLIPKTFASPPPKLRYVKIFSFRVAAWKAKNAVYLTFRARPRKKERREGLGCGCGSNYLS